MLAYVYSLKRGDKQQYATAYMRWILDARPRAKRPTPSNTISALAAQRTRITLAAIALQDEIIYA